MDFDPVTAEILDRLIGRHQSNRSPWWQELLSATICGLASTFDVECVTNQQIRENVHRELRKWTDQSIYSVDFRFRHFVPALRDGVVGSFSLLERGESDLLLLVSPIGVVHRSDPGRAFHLSAELAGTVDADPRTLLCAGAVGVIGALLSSGVRAVDALPDTARFLRPFDWSGDLVDILSGGGGRHRRGGSGCSPQEVLADAVSSLLSNVPEEPDVGTRGASDELSSQLLALIK